MAEVLTAQDDCSPEARENNASPVVRFLPNPFTLTMLFESVLSALDQAKLAPVPDSWNPCEIFPEFLFGRYAMESKTMIAISLSSPNTSHQDDSVLNRFEGPDSFATANIDDNLLSEHVQHALRRTGYLSFRTIDVDVRDRIVTFNGRISSYYLKQIAQAAALSVQGIRYVCNELEVV